MINKVVFFLNIINKLIFLVSVAKSDLLFCVDPLFGVLFQLLAGADINARTRHDETSLHLAAEKDHSSICSILLGNKIDFDALDENQKNGKSITQENHELL